MKGKLTEVYRTQGDIEAQVIKSKLEASDIPCILRSDGAPSVHMVPFSRLGWTQVCVPEEMAEMAERLIGETLAPGDGDPRC